VIGFEPLKMNANIMKCENGTNVS